MSPLKDKEIKAYARVMTLKFSHSRSRPPIPAWNLTAASSSGSWRRYSLPGPACTNPTKATDKRNLDIAMTGVTSGVWRSG